MSDNLFQRKGFRSSPFNPMGVTEYLDQEVPPPVGYPRQIMKTIRSIIQMKEYAKTNMGYAIIGEYGSGKTNFMKYIFRNLYNQGFQVSFNKFQPKNPSVKAVLEKARKEFPSDKLFIILDEIDDIPRMIKNGEITAKEATIFIKEIAAIFEPDGDIYHPIPKDIVIILGMGIESWRHFGKTRPDIVESRFRGKSTTLRAPLPWQMQGLVRRNIYYYGLDELKEKMKDNPYYPFSEGIALSLAKISAITESNKNLNTRFIVKFFDRLIYHLMETTKGSIIREFTNSDLISLLSNPEDYNFGIEGLDKSLINIHNSIEIYAGRISKEFGLQKDEIQNFLYRIYFDHTYFTENEIENGPFSSIPIELIDSIERDGILQKILIIKPKTDQSSDVKRLINRISIDDKDIELNDINIVSLYNVNIDTILADQSWQYLDRSMTEYSDGIWIQSKDIENLPENERELFKTMSESVYTLNDKIWQDLINENLVEGIELKGFNAARNLLIAETPSVIEKKFANQICEIVSTNISNKNANIFTVTPLLQYRLIWETATRGFEKQAEKILNSTLRSNDTIDGTIFLLPRENIIEIEPIPEITNNLLNRITMLRDSDETIPVFAFYIPIDFITYVIYKKQIENDGDKSGKNIKYALENFFSETITESVRFYREKDRLPLNISEFAKGDVKKLNIAVKSLWISIIKGNTDVDELSIEIKEKFGKEFYFNNTEIISPIEQKLLDIIRATNYNSFKAANFEEILNKKFCLSYSRLETKDLLHLLTCKDVLFSDRSYDSQATKNQKFLLNNGKENDKILKSLDKLISEKKEEIKETVNTQTYLNQNYDFTSGSSEILGKYNTLAIKLNILVEKNQEIKSLWNNNISITGEFMLSLSTLLQQFNVENSSFNQQIQNTNEEAMRRKNELTALKFICKELENKIIETKIAPDDYYEIFDKAAQASLNYPIERTIHNLIQGEIYSIDEKLVRDRGYTRDRIELEKSCNVFEDLHRSLKNLTKDVKLEIYNSYYSEISDFTEYKKYSQFPSFIADLAIEDLPQNEEIRKIYQNFILRKLEEESKDIKRTIMKFKKKTETMLNNYHNLMNWLVKRGSSSWDIWNECEVKIIEYKDNLKKINDKLKASENIVSSDILEFVNLKSDINNFGEEYLYDYWDIIKILGFIGTGRAIDPDKLFENIDPVTRLKVINHFIKSGLLKQSLST